MFEEWFARFVAAVLGPLRFEHSPLNRIRLALELLDGVPDLLIGEIGLLNFHCQALRFHDEGSRHDRGSLPRRARRVAREPVIAPMMKAMMNPKRPTMR